MEQHLLDGHTEAEWQALLAKVARPRPAKHPAKRFSMTAMAETIPRVVNQADTQSRTAAVTPGTDVTINVTLPAAAPAVAPVQVPPMDPVTFATNVAKATYDANPIIGKLGCTEDLFIKHSTERARATAQAAVPAAVPAAVNAGDWMSQTDPASVEKFAAEYDANSRTIKSLNISKEQYIKQRVGKK